MIDFEQLKNVGNDPLYGSHMLCDGWTIWAGDKFKGIIAQCQQRLNVALTFCHKYECAVDVGACYGLYSYYLSHRFGKVYAFEPFVKNVEAIKANLHLFSSASRFVLEPYGLSDKEEGMQIITGPEGGLTTYYKDEGVCQFRTLDSLNLNPDFLKIDAEGMDLKVLKGAEETLKRSKPVIMIEDTRTNTKKERAKREHSEWYEEGQIPEYLQTFGYLPRAKIGIDWVYSVEPSK